MKPLPQACRNCKWLDVPVNAAGRRIVRESNAYKCIYPAVQRPRLPDSILTHYDFRWPGERRWMWPLDGQKCETYEERGR